MKLGHLLGIAFSIVLVAMGMAYPHGSRNPLLSGDLFKAQVEAGLKEVFIKELRADVERSRNLVRLGMSGVALAAGTDGAHMSMMDDMASRATEENFFLQAMGIGLAVWEGVRIVGESLDVCQKEGIGAALAHAGVETAKEVALAVTGAKALKLAGKALKLAKGSKIVGKVGEKLAGALPDAVGSYVPEGLKTVGQRAGALVKKGTTAVGNLDRKLDTAVSTQVQKLRGRGATGGAGQSMPAPQADVERLNIHQQKRGVKTGKQEKCPIKMKQEALKSAQKEAVEVRTLLDGRIRYHEIERASKKPGPTRGNAFTTEHDPKTGRIRTWEEGRDHSGNVIRLCEQNLKI